MTAATTIEWTDATWNPVRGCTRVSAGCTKCYAEAMVARFSGRDPRTGKPMWGAGFATSKGIEPRWTGKVALIPDQLDWPLRWKGSKKAKAEGRPSRIFVNSTSDLFHEKLSDEDIDKVFAVMALAPHHTFQVLTKRADRMRAYMTRPDIGRFWFEQVDDYLGAADEWPFEGLAAKVLQLPNVWLGVSTEDQETADERIPHLLETPAAVRFISAEPLIGPIDLRHFVNVYPVMTTPLYAKTGNLGKSTFRWERTKRMSGEVLRSDLDWVITGGESGRDARPAHPDWYRTIRDQCEAAGVPFFFKQFGEWKPDSLLDSLLDGLAGGPIHRGLLIKSDGSRPPDDAMEAMMAGTFDYTGWQHLSAVGKHEAGFVLDGCLHREFPRA